MMAEFSFFGALFLSQSELSVCNQETDYVILHGTMSKGMLHKSGVCIHEALRTPEVIVQMIVTGRSIDHVVVTHIVVAENVILPPGKLCPQNTFAITVCKHPKGLTFFCVFVFSCRTQHIYFLIIY